MAAADGDQVIRRTGDHNIDTVLQRDVVRCASAVVDTACDVQRPIAVEERFAVVTKDDVASAATGNDVAIHTTDDGVDTASQLDGVSAAEWIAGVALNTAQQPRRREGHRAVIAQRDADVVGRTA